MRETEFVPQPYLGYGARYNVRVDREYEARKAQLIADLAGALAELAAEYPAFAKAMQPPSLRRAKAICA